MSSAFLLDLDSSPDESEFSDSESKLRVFVGSARAATETGMTFCFGGAASDSSSEDSESDSFVWLSHDVLLEFRTEGD